MKQNMLKNKIENNFKREVDKMKNEIINIEDIKDILDSKKSGVSGIESYGKMRLFL